MRKADLSQDKERGARNIERGTTFLRILLMYFEFSQRRICKWELITLRWPVFLRRCVTVSVLDQTQLKGSIKRNIDLAASKL